MPQSRTTWSRKFRTEANRDMVGIKPREQQVIKEYGSKKMTVMNRRLVRELDPRKTSFEAQPNDQHDTTSSFGSG